MAICYEYARITICYAPSATRSGVTPLILRASPNATIRFRLGRPTFCNFHPKSTPETISEGQKSLKFSWGGIPPDPPSRHATRFNRVLEPPFLKVHARCRVKVALRHTYVVLRMRRLVRHLHDVCAIPQSPEVARGLMVRA